MSNKIEIPAIHDDDLKNLLTKLGIDEQIEKGEIVCPISGTLITWDNIGAIIFNKGSLSIICDSSECLESLNQYKNG